MAKSLTRTYDVACACARNLDANLHWARVRLVSQLREAPQSHDARIRQTRRMVAFGLIGSTGVVVNTAVLWFFYRIVEWNHLVGVSLGTQASTTWNLVFAASLVYRKASNGTRTGRAARFFIMNNLLLLGRLPVLEALVKLGAGVFIANGITLIMLFLIRFIVSDRVIFRSAASQRGDDAEKLARGTQRARLTVAWSARRLVKLAAWLLPVPDRARFSEEFLCELWDLAEARAGRWLQISYSARQLIRAPRLRREVKTLYRRKAPQ